ncbi:MAG: hypothetical protein KBC56_01235 [Flavobacterium sp.]|nr:hypothetical protein [Flavobacterium sp.]
MKKLVLLFLLVTQFAFSQVGINTTDPKAQLEIKSSNQAAPTNTDGILIPKIDAFPGTNPTADQQGMMVYLTTISAGKQPDFYYWDNTTLTWKSIGGTGTSDHDFYEVGTTTAPDAITDNMFHTGNVGIGNNNPTYKLDVDETAAGKIYAMRVRHSNPVDGGINSGIQSTISGGSISGIIQGVSTNVTPSANTTAKGLRNLIGGTSEADVTGVDNVIWTVGSGTRTGVANGFIGTGAGITFGVHNAFSNPNAVSLGVKSIFTAAGIRDKTGVDNVISNSTGGFHTGISNTFTNNNGAMEETGVFSQFTGSSVGNIRGIYNEITNSGSGNVHYGLYNNINGSGGLERYGVENVLSGTSAGTQYGVQNDISTSGTNRTHYGVRNYLSGTGTGSRIGTDNWLAGSGSGDQYGVNNYIDNSGVGNKYGVYNHIPSATNGLHYGVYSDVRKANSYAGYFLGRFSIGTTTANNYILPSSRGTVNQIMQTDATGNVTWQNPNFALNGFAWTTTGNSGTSTATNFIGTTDDVDIVFKRYNVRAGLLRDNASGGDTSFGVSALNPASTGSQNTAVGYSTLGQNTTGSFNSAFGWIALESNTIGSQNSAFGSEALMENTVGNNNTAFGYRSSYVNIGGSYNTAFGANSLTLNMYMNNNVAIGYQAMEQSGNFTNSNVAYDTNNVAVGVGALTLNNPTATTNGINNVGIGHKSLTNNTTGANNTALGFQAGDANTTGNNNISIGANSDVLNPAGNNQMSIANVIYGDAMDNISTARFSIGAVPSVNNKFYTYSQQLTANGDGQSAIYGYRTRDSRNDGVAYSRDGSNSGVKGYNLWGDLYSFGVSGFSDNDETAGYSRSGGVLGAKTDGTYWGSLGYRSSGLTNYGVYASAANYGTGTGRMTQSSQSSIGGGFYGGLIGSWSKGEIGSINSGTLFASYNSGDEYTSGKQIEIVETNAGKKAAYTVTSTEAIIYKKGKIVLTNGMAYVAFDSDYAALLGDTPIVTTTPMGQCNGIYIESIDKSGFTIKELNNGTSNVAVSWIAVGDRIDASKKIQTDVLANDFDSDINQVMFNENNKGDNAKAVWSDGNKINFGKLPENLMERPVKKEATK